MSTARVTTCIYSARLFSRRCENCGYWFKFPFVIKSVGQHTAIGSGRAASESQKKAESIFPRAAEETQKFLNNKKSLINYGLACPECRKLSPYFYNSVFKNGLHKGAVNLVRRKFIPEFIFYMLGGILPIIIYIIISYFLKLPIINIIGVMPLLIFLICSCVIFWYWRRYSKIINFIQNKNEDNLLELIVDACLNSANVLKPFSSKDFQVICEQLPENVSFIDFFTEFTNKILGINYSAKEVRRAYLNARRVID